MTDIRQQVIETALQMNASGLNKGTSGNVSARTDDGFVITPSGIAYDQLTPDHIVRMDLEGGYYGELRPSSEWRMHSDIYRAHPSAGAVVHTHSTHATALSCLHMEIPAFHYMIAVAGGASIRCADYATFGTEALSEAMLVALRDRSACLLGNHGQIAFGPGLGKALWLAGEVEELAHQYWLVRQAGEPILIDGDEMERVLDRFRSYGKQPDEIDGDDPLARDMPIRRST
ncbi:class II aldolase/adducin family protein [Coralliovum pocilloporae]|uniref:class II aldolase/adducin family protein n=1 Tax=Coralliovum pocilloporae TaxID=3066369 RepID=UPI003306AD65